MIVGVGPKVISRTAVNIKTHGERPHTDEMVGATIYERAYPDVDVFLVRNRDPEDHERYAIVIDVGGGEFDHHNLPEGEPEKVRPTGEKYASAGLVWRKYGTSVIKRVMYEEGVTLSEEEILEVAEMIDRDIMIPVDLEDNGKAKMLHVFSFVPKFLPSWTKKANYDEAFLKAQRVVSQILHEEIRDRIMLILARKCIREILSQSMGAIIEIPAQNMSWKEEFVSFNQTHQNRAKFAVFPYSEVEWAAQCVPPAEDEYKQLVPFPKEWAGKEGEALSEITGVSDATACVGGRFFIRARSRESVIKLCEMALEMNN